MIAKLPEKYWDFIMDYLPDYSSRDDVLQSDIFTRYLNGEDVLKEDYEHFFAGRSIEEIEKEYFANEQALFSEAFENFMEPNQSKNSESSLDKFNIRQLGSRAFIPAVDGAFYVTESRIYTPDEFLTEYLGWESFIFEVTGPMDDDKMQRFNSLSDRMNYLRETGCDLRFFKPAKESVRTNLIMCGGKEMPSIVGGMLKKFYFENLTARTTMDDCIAYLAETDAAEYRIGKLEKIYRVKIAQLLLCTFTGMRLGSEWNGRQEVNGGYIVVKKDGDVVAFHSTIADEFKDFLVAKMLMESPSHSRHKDMTIYKEGGKYYLELALQLHFALK